MAVDLKKLLGIPSQSPEEQKKEEVVKTPEFDLTKFAKALVPIIAVVLGGVIAALKANDVEEVTEPAVLLGVLAVVTAAVLGMCFLAAVDIAARAFLSGEGSAQKTTDDGKGDGEKEAAAAQIIPMPPGALVWLKDDDRPLPLLAVAGSGTGSASYLVASGEVFKAGKVGEEQDAIKGAPTWENEEKVTATKPAKWKP